MAPLKKKKSQIPLPPPKPEGGFNKINWRSATRKHTLDENCYNDSSQGNSHLVPFPTSFLVLNKTIHLGRLFLRGTSISRILPVHTRKALWATPISRLLSVPRQNSHRAYISSSKSNEILFSYLLDGMWFCAGKIISVVAQISTNFLCSNIINSILYYHCALTLFRLKFNADT